MKVYEATEQAYKNGYAKGYKDGKSGVEHKGCKFCEDYDVMAEIVCYLPNDNGGATDIPINYCPNCGRNISDL